MEETYLKDEFQLKNGKLVLLNDQITVVVANGTVEYKNSYTAFSFDLELNQLCAENFKLTVSPQEAKLLNNWLMDLFI